MHSRENSKPNRIDHCIYVRAEANGKVLAAGKETAEANGKVLAAGKETAEANGKVMAASKETAEPPRGGAGGGPGKGRTLQSRLIYLDLFGFAWICLDLLGFTWIHPACPCGTLTPSAQTPASFLCSMRPFAAIPSSIPSG
jgi:hypothetical protein